MRFALALIALVGCRDDKHSLPTVKPGSDEPTLPAVTTPSTPTIDTSTVGGRLRELFGATQSPDVSASIAKLEAQRATVPQAERKLVDRTIAILRAGEAAAAEKDRGRSRQLQLQLLQNTIALLDDMAAFAPDDVDTITMVAASFHIMASHIESLELADDLPPQTVKQKARALADRLVKTNPNSAKAWGVLATVAAYRDYDTRLRGFARCVKLEPANAPCKEHLDAVRREYVQPYCEGADVKPSNIEWREASLKPIAGATPIEYHYETVYVASVPRFTFKDVIRVDAGETTTVHHREDGTTQSEHLTTVDFKLAPAKLEAMIAWTRALEARGDRYATFQNGKLLFMDGRAMIDEGSLGLSNAKIDEFCVKTKQRALPAD